MINALVPYSHNSQPAHTLSYQAATKQKLKQLPLMQSNVYNLSFCVLG